RDPERAAAVLEGAGAESLDPALLARSAEIYTRAGRFDQAIQRSQHALLLDPKNPIVYAEAMIGLLMTRRPLEAVRVADLASAEFPGDFRPWRSSIVWSFTGNGLPGHLRGTANQGGDITANSDSRSVSSVVFPLRLQHRYREMVDYL